MPDLNLAPPPGEPGQARRRWPKLLYRIPAPARGRLACYPTTFPDRADSMIWFPDQGPVPEPYGTDAPQRPGRSPAKRHALNHNTPLRAWDSDRIPEAPGGTDPWRRPPFDPQKRAP